MRLLVATSVSALLGWVGIRVGPALGLIDTPDLEGLKPHHGAAVPLGGVGVLVGLHSGLLIAGWFEWGLFVSTTLLWVTGVLDDMFDLDPRVRLLAAAGAGVLLALLGDQQEGWLFVLASAALVVVLVNAVNLFDGLDLLAGSVCAIIAVELSVLGMVRGLPGATAPVVLAAALLGFLAWNLPPARLFLGDNGAYVIGVALAWGVMRVSPDLRTGMVSAALVGIPILDLVVTVLRRLRAGLPLFGGDRDHLYDRVHARGLSVVGVSLFFAGAQLAWGGLLIGIVQVQGDTVAASTALVLGFGLAAILGFTRPRSSKAPSHRNRG